MKVMNKGVEREIKILTHFKFDTDEDYNTEYVLYTDSEHEGVNLYLARLFYDNNKVEFIMPDREKFEDLRKIIENLINNNPNSFIFSQKKYKYIGMEALEIRSLEEVEFQKVQLNPEQYKNLVSNKYLTYPLNNKVSTTAMSNPKYTKNNKLFTIISSIVLALYLCVLLLLEPDLSHNLFNFDKLSAIIATFNFDKISLYGITPAVILHLSVVTLILAVFSYYYEESKPVMFYLLSFLFLFVFSVIFYSHTSSILPYKLIDLNHIGDYSNVLKGLAVFAAVNALIVTIAYQAFKGITVTITEDLKVNSFVVHYTIFLVLFMIGTIGLMIFYDYNIYEHVAKFVSNTIMGI